MTVFFTADTHFGSERVLHWSQRPFSTVAEMDDCIIANWNNIVTHQDRVYHLGDFGELDKLPELNGHIIFLPGNDDTPEKVEFIAASYDIINPNTVITLEGDDFQLVHEPDEAQPSDNFFLFGHIHKLQMVKRNGLNVGVDCHNFCPIPLETVLFYRDAILNAYDENVFLETLAGV
jgi:calcineurin-like phosphoesterase family protein